MRHFELINVVDGSRPLAESLYLSLPRSGGLPTARPQLINNLQQIGNPNIALMLVNDQNRGCTYERDKKHMDEKGSYRANESVSYGLGVVKSGRGGYRAPNEPTRLPKRE